jgi:uncharacterized membrane protein
MSPRFRPEPKPATPAASNVRTIVELERRAALERSRADTIGETVARWAGTLGFVLVQVALFLVWSAWNTWAPVRWRFDPYPYGLLTFLVSLEGVLIATFVLIAQNRLSRRTERRDQLHLQIALLAEQELTVALRLLRDTSARLGATPAAETLEVIDRLTEDTDVHELAQTLEKEAEQDGS